MNIFGCQNISFTDSDLFFDETSGRVTITLRGFDRPSIQEAFQELLKEYEQDIGTITIDSNCPSLDAWDYEFVRCSFGVHICVIWYLGSNLTKTKAKLI
jgi:hypothetical protein